MKQSVLLSVVAFVCAGAAVADEFTWTGGSSGDWTAPGNWSAGEGYPVAGDTAIFNDDATITSDFALGGGEDADSLTLQIAAGKTLTVNASISGTGGVTRQGDGALKLMKANPFTGTYVSVPTDAQAKGHTYVYDAGALGLSSADFNPSSGCAAVHFDAVNAPDGTLTFDIPIRLPIGSTGVGTYTVYFANGKIIFNKSVTSSGRMTVSVSNATEVRFKEKLTAGGWLDMGSFPKTCHFYYEKGVSTTGVWYHSGSSASHHVWTSDNKFYFASADSYGGMGSITLVCEDEDVVKNCTSLKSFGWKNGDSGTAYVDLKGHDQHYPAFANGCVLKTSDFGFTSSEDLPAANVILAGNHKNDLAFNGQFKGRAGLTWNPTSAEREFLLSNVVSGTKGSLKALNGVLRLAGGTSFSSLSTLEVGATGRLTLDADAGAQTEADEVVVAEGGELAIPAGKTVRCRIASYKGDPIADGTYPQDGSLDFLPGEGVLIVDSSVLWAGAASGDWDEPSNWKSGVVPSAGQKVRIAGDVQVSLSGTTAQMSKLSLAEGATLVMTDWNAVLKADDVCVGEGATITTDGPFATADDAPASRVHVVCGTLTVDEGGKIDVKAKGWQGGVYKSDNVYGYGPGSPRNESKYGAAHGGYGAIGVHGGPGPGRVPFGVPYDDPHAPVLPGSGAGSNSSSYPGTSGGGAVLIEATGAVVVNGAIDASAGDASAVTRMNLTSEKCGSGGSVWIKSATVSGAGSILANGGNGDTGGGSPTFYWSYFDASGSKGGPYAGGGGMIRIEYGAGQTAVTDNALVVSAACGYYAGLADGSWRMPAAWHDKYRSEADLGTLTFTDTTLVDQLLGKGLAGRLVDVREYTYEGDLVWTSGHVRFATEGVDVRFTGDLTVSNDVSRLEIGGIETGTNRSMYVDRYAGKLFNKLTVDGDLKLLNGSALDIRAAEKSETQAWGGEVSVGKDFTVGAGSYLYPWCDVLNTGAPHFTVGGAFTLEEGATVMADRRGGAPGHSAGNATAGLNAYFGFSRSNGYGAGAGTGGAGAGHGGDGGRGVNGTALSGTAGTAVDDEWEPVLPGAGGGSSGYGEGGEGGGLFHLVAQGPVVIDGTITANGFLGTYSTATYGHYFGSGAGGGVFLAGASFTGGASACISAQGGHAISIEDADGKQHAAGCGAGGRVAIAVGMDQKTGPRPRAVKSESADVPEIAELFSFAGVIDVGGGTNIWGTTGKTVAPVQIKKSLGGDGTVRFLRWTPTPGLLLMIR